MNTEFKDEPTMTPLRASINRPQTLLGGDRELVILGGLLCAVLAVSVLKFWSFIAAGILWLCIAGVLARIGKADPLMRQVYLRHLKYRDWYPARSGRFLLGRGRRMSWK